MEQERREEPCSPAPAPGSAGAGVFLVPKRVFGTATSAPSFRDFGFGVSITFECRKRYTDYGAAVAAKKLGRNAPRRCGSGKKYKNCHLPADEGAEAEKNRDGRTVALKPRPEYGKENRGHQLAHYGG
jgi:hypothetical protein